MTCDNERLNSIPESVDTQNSSRKGKPWALEEGRLLVKLREEQNLAWLEVLRHFTQRFPGRSKGSIQVYWGGYFIGPLFYHPEEVAPAAGSGCVVSLSP